MFNLTGKASRCMKLSIIIPVFNDVTCIGHAIDSVLKQQFADWELIIVDDGSTDGTADVIDRIASTDKRISVVHQVNAGPGAARNTGLDAAHGEYVAFLDSDDELASTHILAAMVERIDDRQCDVLLSRARLAGTSGEAGDEMPWCLRKDIVPDPEGFTPQDAGVSLFFVAGPVPWGKIYRRKFLSWAQIRFPPLPRSEDFPFVQTAMACAGKIAVYDGISILHRTGRATSLENTKDETPLMFAEAETIFFKMLEDHGLWDEFALAAKARAMLRLAYNLNAIQSLDGLRAVFAYVYEERKKLDIADIADSFRDYVSAKRVVDGVLSHGSAEAWVYARMAAAEKALRTKEIALRKAKKDNEMLTKAQDAQNALLLQSRREVLRLKQRAALMEEKSLALECSGTYRVGMFVTWPARKAWGGVKCLRENGLKYTVKHAVGKVLRTFGSRCRW